MANNRTLTTNPMTILDLTDSRKLDVYISSNLPTTQIYDANTNPATYTPDWSSTNLTLTASVYLDSSNITGNTGLTISWHKKIGTGNETNIDNNTSILTISTNELSNNNTIITYICRVVYQGITSFKEVSFTRVDAGINGTSAPTVKAKYSVDGTDNSWVDNLDTSIHKYINLSYDNGTNWTGAIKIAGQDGTSVTIEGTAYYDETLSDSNIGESLTLYSDSSLTTTLTTAGLNIGDAYIVQGYLCVFAQTENKFICTGRIQGPQGQQGVSSYTYIKYATSSSGENMSNLPNGKTYIGIVTTTESTAPLTANSYTWSKFVGDDAKNIILTADTQVFKISGSNTITPSTITVTAQTSNTEITNWYYSLDGGRTFQSTPPDGVSLSGINVIVSGANLNSNSLTIKASDGTYSDAFTVYKVSDGANGEKGDDGQPAPLVFLTNENITFVADTEGKISGTSFTTNVVGYVGGTKFTPTIGVITGFPTGMNYVDSTTIGNELILSFTIDNNATLGSSSNINGALTIPITSPVITTLKLNWSKVNMGISIDSVVSYFANNQDANSPPNTGWDTTPHKTINYYTWRKDLITYSDGTSEYTTPVCITGDKGDQGVSPINVEITSSVGNLYINNNISTTLTAKVYQANIDITNEFPDSAFLWEKYDIDGVRDPVWSFIGKSVQINNVDIWKRAVFNCVVDIEERF